VLRVAHEPPAAATCCNITGEARHARAHVMRTQCPADADRKASCMTWHTHGTQAGLGCTDTCDAPRLGWGALTHVTHPGR
jgi:hypothetical protein